MHLLKNNVMPIMDCLLVIIVDILYLVGMADAHVSQCHKFSFVK